MNIGSKAILWSTGLGLFVGINASAEVVAAARPQVKVPYQAASSIGSGEVPAPAIPGTRAPVKPFRTFVHIQRYTMEQNGEPGTPISNVRIEVSFPKDATAGKEKHIVPLPEGGQYWPIGNGQVQEINRTFEIPFAMIEKDGFKFSIQMVRKGSPMLPCNFDVSQLSQFNRAYVCRTDTNWQAQNLRLKEEQLDKEGIQIRVFTDINAKPSEIPVDAIALK